MRWDGSIPPNFLKCTGEDDEIEFVSVGIENIAKIFEYYIPTFNENILSNCEDIINLHNNNNTINTNTDTKTLFIVLEILTAICSFFGEEEYVQEFS